MMLAISSLFAFIAALICRTRRSTHPEKPVGMSTPQDSPADEAQPDQLENVPCV